MKKRITAVLLLLCMLLAVVSCNVEGGGSAIVPVDENQGSADELAVKIADDELGIIANGKSDYVVILADNASGDVKEACNAAIASLAEKTGVTLKVGKESDAPVAKEILIGATKRSEFSGLAPAAKEVIVKVVGEKIVALAGAAGKNVAAVEYTLGTAIMCDMINKTATIEKNYNHAITAGEFDVIRASKTTYDFVINPFTEDATFGRISFTGNHGWRLQTKINAIDAFKDTGASQRLAISLDEEAPLTKEAVTFTAGPKYDTLKASDGSYARIYKSPFSLEVYTAKGVQAANIGEISNTEKGCTLTGLFADEDEAVFGGGQKFNAINQRGKRLDIYTYDMWNQDDGCYVAIPLLCFTRGSGVFFNMYEQMMLDLGKEDYDVWSATINVAGSRLDCYIFATDQMSDVLYGYSALSGFAAQPEEWTYGMIVCRYSPDFSTIKGMELAIDMMEYFDLPWTGLLLESWGTYSSDATHNNQLKELCAKVHAMGKKVMVYIRMGDPAMQAAGYNANYLLKASYVDEKTGQTKTMTTLPQVKKGDPNPDNGGGGWYYLDLTNEDAVNWFYDTMWYNLTQDIGVDGAKIDFCEEIPENYNILYADGTTETQGSHHWYPVYFCSLYWRMLSKLPDGGMCFTRGGGIGSQRNPFMWAGDQARNMNKMYSQIRGLLSSGFSGVPYMSYDMSGYQYDSYGGRILYDSGKYDDTFSVDDPNYLSKVKSLMYYAKSDSTRVDSAGAANIMPVSVESEIFLRGTEFTAFTANMQTHGKVRRSYDFAMEGDTATTDIYRAYVKLHESLTPYITEYAKIASETGMPLARHLALMWQDDVNTYTIEDEYMFGDAFLVAPKITTQSKSKTRDIYLPEGKWKDLNSGTTYTVGAEGKWLKGYVVSMSTLPVFLNMESDSTTVDQVVPCIEEMFAYTKTLTCSYE